MNRRAVDINELMPLIKETLQENRAFYLPVKGHSMWPFLLNSRSTVELKKPTTYKPGLIYLFKTEGTIYLHRLKKVNSDGSLLFQGDALLKKECANQANTIGMVTRIKRKHKWHSATRSTFLSRVRLWKMLGPLRPRIRKLFFIMKRDHNDK
mgnify:CR=1 FL=1